MRQRTESVFFTFSSSQNSLVKLTHKETLHQDIEANLSGFLVAASQSTLGSLGRKRFTKRQSLVCRVSGGLHLWAWMLCSWEQSSDRTCLTGQSCWKQHGHWCPSLGTCHTVDWGPEPLHRSPQRGRHCPCQRPERLGCGCLSMWLTCTCVLFV